MVDAWKNRLYRLLRWSERYTKTDMVYLAQGGFWLALGQVGIGLIAFLLSIAFAHFVSKDSYGTYRFLLSLYWTLSAFSYTGLSAAVVRAVALGQEGAFRQSFRLSFLGSLPMSAIAAGLAVWYLAHGNATLFWGALVIALVGPLYQLGYLYGSLLEGKRAFKHMALFGLVLNGVPALVMLGAMLYPQSALIFFLIYLGMGALTSLALCWLSFIWHKPNKVPGEHVASLGWHFSLMNILNTIATQIDQLLVFHFLGGAQLAVYAFATAIPDQARTLFGTVESLAMPKFVQRPIAEIRKTLNVRLLNFSLLGAVGTVAYILAAPFIFRVIYPAYSDAVIYTQLYALTLLPIAVILPPAILQAHAATRELYYYNLLSPIFQIVALIIGVVTAGLVGVIVVRILSRLFSLCLGIILLKVYGSRV